MELARVPPNNQEAEQSVLSSILFDKDAIDIVSGILQPADFYRPDHAEIYKAMLLLHKNNTPVDTVTLKSELTQHGIFEQVGGIAYLGVLAKSYYTSANVKHHALEIKRLSELRQNLKRVMELLQKPNGITADDLKAAALDSENSQYIKSYVEKSDQNIDDFKASLRKKKQRIMTGFKQLDAITGGLRIPSVAIIGAYPSVGKTAFSLNIAAKQDLPVIFFSLEMSSEMIYERMASSLLKIDYDLFLKQQMSEEQYQKVEAFSDMVKESKFHVFDDAYYIEQQIAVLSTIRPGLAIVDYIQKVKTHKKTEARRHEIDYISGIYKQIAKDYNCVILLLSQLTRNANLQIKPTMSNLKESGALEADGDYVGILHRPYVLRKDEPNEVRPEEGYILIDKNKFGNTGQIDLHFNGIFQQFYELEEPRVNNRKPNKKAKSGKKCPDGFVPMEDEFEYEELPFE